jgi:hypothetical protein
MADLGDYLNSINQTKQNLMRGSEDPKAVSAYPAFLIRRLLSYHKDCIQVVNEINCIPDLENQLQYEYLLHMLPKGKRWAKLHKTATSKNLELVKKFYGYSDAKAMEVLSLFSEKDFSNMERALDEGGVIEASK